MKHAFLITAHKTDYTLETLITLLDHPDNDIFLHMDKKSRGFDSFYENYLRSLLKHSTLYITKRINVNWGGFSQVQSELILMNTALRNMDRKKYDYFHLLSGEDLPIKPMKEIHSFFEANKGFEFIRIESAFDGDLPRVQYRHFLQDKIGRRRSGVLMILKIIYKATLHFQKVLHIKRNTDTFFYRGPQWFSLTSKCVKFILSNQDYINKVFHQGYCTDELFIHTVLWNHNWKNSLYPMIRNVNNRTVYGECLRLIDWKRGRPYVWRKKDYEQIVNTDNCLFCRKFDCRVDKEIITMIRDYVLSKSK